MRKMYLFLCAYYLYVSCRDRLSYVYIINSKNVMLNNISKSRNKNHYSI